MGCKTYNQLFYILNSIILAFHLVPGQAFAALFIVDSTADTVDVAPGDWVCADVSGNCSLRAAIMEANADPGSDIVNLGAATYTLTIPGNAEHAAATGDLDILNPVTINGVSPAATIIDGGGIDRIFEIINGGNVSISRLTVQNGVAGVNTPGYFVNYVGGGIYNVGNTSVVNLYEIDVRNNSARSGGGVYTMFSTMGIRDSTVRGNSATAGSGGGIAEGLAGYLRVYNSTISGNSATGGGGGALTTNNPATYSNVTLVNNIADSDNDGSGNGGGFAQGIAAPNLQNTIVAMNVDMGGESPDCSGGITSSGYNVIGDDTGCTVSAGSGDQIGTGASPLDPLLAPLGDNGGATPTHALLNGSPALDNGNPAVPGSGGTACEGVDQRGIDRTGTTPCDIGAFEYAPAQGLSFTVNSTIDQVDASIGDGQCETVPGNNECTLRAAIQETNALIGDNQVFLPAGNYVLSIAGSGEDQAASGDLDITDNLEIIGSGSAGTVINANSIDRVFHTRFADYFTLSGVSLVNGNVTGEGGGINHTARALNVSDCVIDNNTASGNGGGLFTVAFKTLTVSDCVISNNTAGFYGGGISNFTFSTLTLTDSTLSGNSAATGGGLMNSFMSSATVTGSTINNNTAQSGGGVGTLFGSGTVTLNNSTVSGNQASVSGGGINVSTNDTVNLRNTTVTANSAVAAADGGGVGGNGTINLRNSVIAGNIDTGGEAPDCNATLTSQDYNLLGDDTACTFVTATGDQVGTALSPINPLLGPLAANGGTTLTHIPLTGSPLLNAANPAVPGSGGSACEGNDQRALDRQLGTRCDIGAVEAIIADLGLGMSGSTTPVLPGSTTTYVITLTNTGPDTAYNIVLTDTLPAGAAYIGAAGSGWSCTDSGAFASCTLSSLASGASSGLNLSIQLPNTSGSVTNYTSVTADSIDPDLANNTALTSISIQQPASGGPVITTSQPPANPDSGTTPTETTTPDTETPDAGTPATTDVTPATTSPQTTPPQNRTQQPQQTNNAQQAQTSSQPSSSSRSGGQGGGRSAGQGTVAVIPVRVTTAADTLEERVEVYRQVIDSNPRLWEQLGTMKQEMSQAVEQDSTQEEIILGAAKSVTLVLFAGAMNWFLKAGTLLSSLLSSMPLWAQFDPLPILSLSRKERERQRDEAERLKQQDDHDLGSIGLLLGEQDGPAAAPGNTGRLS